jgi:superfamily II DNA or RNA helicase
MKLRPYQRNACMSAVTGLETAHTLLESPTGTGKTEMAIAISEAAVRRKAGPVLVVAPTDEIYGQMITRYQRAGWQVHADKAERHARPALAMEQALDGCKVVVVASLGTISIRDRIERYPKDGWALPLMDECFPVGTLVDGRPIETIKQGDLVRSYNHSTGRIERRPVVRTFQSAPAQLVTVHLSTGQRVVCTAGHPFFVGHAYRPAAYLQHGDQIYGDARSDAMQGMRSQCQAAKHQGEPRTHEERSDLLLRDLQENVGLSQALRDDGSNEPQARPWAHAGTQSDAQRSHTHEGVAQAQGHGAWAAGARWQWQGTDSDGGPAVSAPPNGLAIELRCGDQAATRQRLPNLLQTGHGTARNPAGGGGGRWEPCSPGAACTGCQEDGVSPVAWVDRVEVHERRGSDGFGSLCPGDRVYNIEVDGNHNYFVDGILVHNCHHAPAATWQGVREYIDQPWLGLSATPEREGMAKLWPNHVRAFENGLMDAIAQGWLVPFEAKYAAGMSQADYLALKSDDPEEVGQALPAAIATLQEALGQRQGIAFWPRTRAAKQAAKYLRSLPEEISARALVGGMPRDERSLALRQYAACTLRMLTLCQVGVEGLDVPPAAVLAIFQQTKIRTRIAQMVGRVLRPDARCLEGLDEATAEERRDAIARSSKPSAFVLSVAPPDAVDGWETPGTLLWGQLPQPVLIDIDRRQRQGKDLETARREAVQAEDDRKKEREAKRAEYERALLAAAPARAQAVANARPYELRDPAMVARDTRRQRLASAWRKWRERARQANVSAKLGHSDIGYKQASDKQAAAIAKLAAEWLREPRVSSPAGDLYREVLTWDSKTAISAQHALRMMCGHGFKQRTA